MESKVRQDVLNTSTGKIEYQIIFTKRKTVGICVDTEKGVIVRVPQYMPIKTVHEIVKEKENWILKHSQEMKHRKEEKPVQNYVDGDPFLYMGKYYPLNIKTDKSIKKNKVVFTGDAIELTLSDKKKGIDADRVKEELITWYKEQASLYAKRRAEYFSKYCKKSPKQIIVKEQKRRWGSCSQGGVIRINWRCVMASEEVFDYVIVHEMCHLRHMNHGSEFWNMVKEIIPDYKEKRLWLKQHGYSLDL